MASMTKNTYDDYRATYFRNVVTYKNGQWIVSSEQYPDVVGSDDSPFVAIQKYAKNLEEFLATQR